MEVLGPTSRTDFTDTQCGSAARALELQLRGRDSVSNGTVRPRPLSKSERRDVPREHPYRRCSSHVARRTVETTPCPQQRSGDHEVTLKAEIDNVRRAQAAASSTPQPMVLSAYGTQNLDAFQKGKEKDRGKPKDNVPTDCGYNIPDGWEEANKPKEQRRQGLDPCQHPAAVE